MTYIIILIGGVLFIILAIKSIILGIRSKNKKEKNVLFIQSALNLALGLLFVLYLSPIVSILGFLGIILLILGALSLINLYSFRKITSIPFFSFVISVLVIIAGIVILFNLLKNALVLLIFLGIILIVYAIGEFYSSWMLKKKYN